MRRCPWRPYGIVLALALAASGVAACGSSNKTTTAGSPATTAATTTASTSSAASAPGTIPTGSVAVAAGRPITRTAFDHWLSIAARAQASAKTPAIDPSDPPAFTDCIAQIRKLDPSLAKDSTKQLKADCSELFAALSSQVMSFLITSDWFEADAARRKLLPSSAQLDAAYNTQKRQAFPTESGFEAFLAKTGQTAADVRFRVLVNEAGQRLLAREKGTQSARNTALTNEVKHLYLAGTQCEPLVVMADCGNDRG
jgi:hypothetical protein